MCQMRGMEERWVIDEVFACECKVVCEGCRCKVNGRKGRAQQEGNAGILGPLHSSLGSWNFFQLVRTTFGVPPIIPFPPILIPYLVSLPLPFPFPCSTLVSLANPLVGLVR